MRLGSIPAPKGANKGPKRLGRGEASGTGKTAGRGHKGQGSRTGSGVRLGFEGGQMPLSRRTPKHGFTNIFRKEFAIVNLSDLERVFDAGASVTLESCQQVGLVARSAKLLKVLANGGLSKKLAVRAHKISAAAQAKITEAGGSAEEFEVPLSKIAAVKAAKIAAKKAKRASKAGASAPQ